MVTLCMTIANMGSVTSYAVETMEEIEKQEDKRDENTENSMLNQNSAELVENIVIEDDLQTESEATEETEENEIVIEKNVDTDTKGFSGEVAVDEKAVSVMDAEGNVTYVDMSKDDTVVEEVGKNRAATPQIVNLRFNPKPDGTIEYTEIATGVAGYTAGSYGADAVYLGKNGKNVKFMLAGVIGQVSEEYVQVIGKSSAKSVSYYAVSNGRLYHYISTNVNSSNYGSTLDNGPAPSYLKNGTKYYSYDGHYFYTDSNFGNMIDDYNNGTRSHSVNPNNPYYNYFQYLPIRSQSNYTGSVLNTMLNNRVTASSKMRDTGHLFVNNQNTYGVNALIIAGIGANESAWGTSGIAQNKNNLFGLEAVDSSPGQNANYFSSVEQCIKEFAEKWMSKEYLNPNNWKYFGGFLGNKASGINIKYASDPYWGEKAAAMAWIMDRSNGNKDAYKYTIGIKDTVKPNNVVNVRKENTTSSTVLYKTKKNANCAFLVLNDTPTNKFYKIQSDGVLNSNRTALNAKSGIYSFTNMYAYISSDYVKIVYKGNGSQTPADSPSSKNGWVTEGGKKYYYVNGSKVKGEKNINGKWYCFDSNSGAMITGWYNLPGKKVYYQPTGEMAYGEQKINGKWYMLKPGTGAMITGWYNLPGKRVYYQPTGEMAYGEQKINGKWYGTIYRERKYTINRRGRWHTENRKSMASGIC